MNQKDKEVNKSLGVFFKLVGCGFSFGKRFPFSSSDEKKKQMKGLDYCSVIKVIMTQYRACFRSASPSPSPLNQKEEISRGRRTAGICSSDCERFACWTPLK